MQRVVDEVITPGLSAGLDAVMPVLVRIITMMGAVYALGVLTSLLYSRIMAVVTQGSLKHMRDDMFDSMERLPLRFFDTHPHGAIMSTYTNDTDAIRQLIGAPLGAAVPNARHGVVSGFGMINYDRGLCTAAAVLAAA